MPCINPRPAWQATLPNPSGKHSINFTYRNKVPDYWIGCGKCDGCTANKRMEWGVRMHHESMMHSRNCFITLTYEDPPEEINRYDAQTFLKRLRHHWPTPLKYFLTGEYGEKTRRPHYHLCLFGEDFLGGAYDINSQLYGNVILDRIWKHGHVAVSEFTPATAMYVAGYTAKKVSDSDTFSIMSRKPPLGKSWLDSNYQNVLRLEKCVIAGEEYPIPSAYLRWLADDPNIINLKERREIKPRLTDRQLDSKQKYYDHSKNQKAEKI